MVWEYMVTTGSTVSSEHLSFNRVYMGTSSDTHQVYVTGTVGPVGPGGFEHALKGYIFT